MYVAMTANKENVIILANQFKIINTNALSLNTNPEIIFRMKHVLIKLTSNL